MIRLLQYADNSLPRMAARVGLMQEALLYIPIFFSTPSLHTWPCVKMFNYENGARTIIIYAGSRGGAAEVLSFRGQRRRNINGRCIFNALKGCDLMRQSCFASR